MERIRALSIDGRMNSSPHNEISYAPVGSYNNNNNVEMVLNPAGSFSSLLDDFDNAPHASFYRDKSPQVRPKISDLLEDGDSYGSADAELSKVDPETKTGFSFGWIEGVYIRCTLSIFGVIMFLRLNWVMAQAGLAGGILIILYSASITTMTTMSMSAIATNGKVAAGGIYFMVSRQLGPDIGAVVGLTLFAAQSLAVAMNLVGFAEAIVSLEISYLVDAEWDAKIFAIIGLGFIFSIAFCGANFEIQAQKVLLVVMIIAIMSFLIGIGLAKPDDLLNSTGVSSATLAENTPAHYTNGNSWVVIFGVFFPAVTGIAAGSSISGDLADPSDAIPKGTFLAVATTTAIYLVMAVLLAATFNPEGLTNIKTQISAIQISVVPELAYAGVFAAALSSALALLIGAPRVLMAVARDDIVNFLAPWKVGYFAKDEPMRGYMLTMAIAFVAIISLDLNSVSPLVTNFYLIQYCFVNLSVVVAHFSKAPGWRPSFRYYNVWVSLLGAMMCIASMFMVDYITAICTIAVSYGIYKYVGYMQPDVNWGESTQAGRHLRAVHAMHYLEESKVHVKNFRPQYLVLSGDLETRPDLVVAMKLLRKSHGIMINGKVIIGNLRDNFEEYCRVRDSNDMTTFGIEGFNSVILAPTLRQGVNSLLQISGLGKLRANTVLMGFKKWQQSTAEENLDYIEIIRTCLLTKHGVAIVKNLTSIEDLLANGDKKQSIDLWWLVEDGGLTMLMAYLLVRHPVFKAKETVMRLFSLSTSADAAAELERLQQLLLKFRINATVRVVIVDHDTVPSQGTQAYFKELSQLNDEDMLEKRAVYFMNLSEKMHEYSGNSPLVVASLPIPRLIVPTLKYFAYLEMLTGTRPTMLVRGNQETVLTYNS